VAGRERVVRLRLRNRDDQPLGLRAVAALAPVERVVFESARGGVYRVTYGQADLPAPSTTSSGRFRTRRLAVRRHARGARGAAARVAQTPVCPGPSVIRPLLWAGLLGRWRPWGR